MVEAEACYATMSKLMVILGTKCPQCGERSDFTPIKGTTWISRLPLSSRLRCNSCGKNLLSLKICTMSHDLRKHQRVRLPRTFLMKIPGKNIQYSRIENISQGGICFDCNCDVCLQHNQTLLIDLYCCDDGSLLEKLPIEILATYEQAPENLQTPVPKLVTGARFLELTQEQKKVLHQHITYQAIHPDISGGIPFKSQ